MTKLQPTPHRPQAFNATPEARTLEGERARYLRDGLRAARRSGLELPANKREEVGADSVFGTRFPACLIVQE
jgi:Zn-dependent oligopeptidase